MNKCKKCRYFDQLKVRLDRGYCHRFPPAPDGKNFNTKDNFPVMSENDWCGEFEKKVAKNKRK